MKNPRRCLLLILWSLLTVSLSIAQWVNTSGSGAGHANAITFAPNGSGGIDLFAGLTGGNVERSTDYGGTWTEKAIGLTSANVLSLLPIDGGGGLLLIAGTNGGGIFISTNHGSDWHAGNTGLTNMIVTTLAASGSKLFAGTKGGGIFSSTDNGETWMAADSGLTNNAVWTIAGVGDHLFAATGGGVFHSIDNGTTWSAVNSGLPSTAQPTLAISTTGNGDTTLYSAVYGGLFRSTDFGTNWTYLGLANLYGGGSGISCQVVSDSTIVAGTGGLGIYLSTDGGTNWISTGIGYGTGYVYSLLACPNGAGGAIFFAGTDYGIFRSTDSGFSWRGINSTVGSAQCLESSGTNLFAGTSHNGVFVSSNSGRDWHSASHGLPPYTLPTHTDKSYVIYALAISGRNVFAATQDGVYCSVDSGATWNGVNNGLPDITWPDHNWVHALIFSGTDLFAATYYGGVFLSTNDGISWTTANTGMTIRDDKSLAASGTHLFAGTSAGVFVSTNNGTNWTYADAPFPSFCKMVEIDTKLYAGTNVGVFRSTNSGTSWIALNNGLTDTVIQSLVSGPGINGGASLFAGTSNSGVFCSIDGGKKWTAVNENLPQDAVNSMTVSDTNLFVGTGSSGVWRRSLSEITRSVAAHFGWLRVSVQNIPGYGVVGSNATVSLFDKNAQFLQVQNTDSTGSAGFNEVQTDTGYTIQVNCIASNPAKIYGSEYWGTLEGLNVTGAETTAVTFHRNAPYTSNINVYEKTTNTPVTGNVPFGTLLEVSIEITNPNEQGSIPQRVECGLTLDRDKQMGYDFQGVTSARDMARGAKDTFDFTVMPPDSGRYFHVAGAQILRNGAYVLSEGGTWGTIPTFVVDPPPPGDVLIKVQATPQGCTFIVDDSTYTDTKWFVWSTGTVHRISVTSVQSAHPGMQYTWNRWSDGDSMSHNVTTPGVGTTYTAIFDTSYFLTMNQNNGGVVEPSSGWFKYGSEVHITARPSAGWKLSGWTGAGKGSYSGSDTTAIITMDSVITESATFEPATGITDLKLGIPSTFTLKGNYPNPFNPTTTIRFGVPTRSAVRITVFTTLGELVGQLVDGEVGPGYHEFRFDGSHLSSGIYFYRMQAGSYVETKTMLLVK